MKVDLFGLADLSPRDDDDWDAWERFDALVETLPFDALDQGTTDPIWQVFERAPETCNHYAWTMIHCLETLPNYESALYRSLSRVPSMLTLTMLERRLNSQLPAPLPPAALAEIRKLATGKGPRAELAAGLVGRL